MIKHQQFSLFENENFAASSQKGAVNGQAGRYSDFIVYVDESGDHNMRIIDPSYPFFVLAFCVFHKRHYCEKVIPALHRFKFNHFGHDVVVLHEHEIRKEKNIFKFMNVHHRNKFLTDLTDIIEKSNFILISCIIDKGRLVKRGEGNDNPYHLALGFCLETLYELIKEKNQQHALTHVVVECRGKREDNELELEFRRICDGANRLSKPLPFDIIFADKKVDSPGLQLADLVARPIGMGVLRPTQENRAFDILKRKFFCSGGRGHVGEGFENWGLKIFPPLESERPR